MRVVLLLYTICLRGTHLYKTWEELEIGHGKCRQENLQKYCARLALLLKFLPSHVACVSLVVIHEFKYALQKSQTKLLIKWKILSKITHIHKSTIVDITFILPNCCQV